jgi:hypothetical protein
MDSSGVRGRVRVRRVLRLMVNTEEEDEWAQRALSLPFAFF